jgi:hypothetical protein
VNVTNHIRSEVDSGNMQKYVKKSSDKFEVTSDIILELINDNKEMKDLIKVQLGTT